MNLENTKKGFLLYFDNAPMLLSLPPEQRGWLLTAVFDYAQHIAQDPGADIPQVLECYPQLTPQAQTACFSVCLNIARDTRRWQNRQQAALRRRQEGGEGRSRSRALTPARTTRCCGSWWRRCVLRRSRGTLCRPGAEKGRREAVKSKKKSTRKSVCFLFWCK